MGYELWSLALSKERRLKVFESRVLRRIFVAKRDKVTGEWRELHNEELNDLYSSPNITRAIKSRMRWVGNVARLGGEERRIQGFWWGKLGKRDDLGNRGVVEGDIKMDLEEVGWGGMDWLGLAADGDRWRALVNVIMNLRVPQNAGNFLTSLETVVSFPKKDSVLWN
jgi:hypothetical protein